MEHDDDSDTSSEDNEDEVEASVEDMEAIMTLEHSLQASPQSYELHAQVNIPPPLPAKVPLSPCTSLGRPPAITLCLDSPENVARRSTSPCCGSADSRSACERHGKRCRSSFRSASGFGWTGLKMS